MFSLVFSKMPLGIVLSVTRSKEILTLIIEGKKGTLKLLYWQQESRHWQSQRQVVKMRPGLPLLKRPVAPAALSLQRPSVKQLGPSHKVNLC